MEQITRSATAGAKINLFLSIGARRADGYHEIDTVMQSLPFGDAVSLRFEAPRSGEQTVLFTTNRLFGEAEKNLGVIAVRAYCRAAGISAYRASLQIEKRIPAGAGFGGGSADAAAVLRLCKAQLGALSERAMHLLCTSIGADVPFCYAGGCFRARGIGEKLEKLPPLAPCHVLLAIGLPHEIAHGSLRLSLGMDNTEEDVDAVLEELPGIVENLRAMSPLAAANA